MTRQPCGHPAACAETPDDPPRDGSTWSCGVCRRDEEIARLRLQLDCGATDDADPIRCGLDAVEGAPYTGVAMCAACEGRALGRQVERLRAVDALLTAERARVERETSEVWQRTLTEALGGRDRVHRAALDAALSAERAKTAAAEAREKRLHAAIGQVIVQSSERPDLSGLMLVYGDIYLTPALDAALAVARKEGASEAAKWPDKNALADAIDGAVPELWEGIQHLAQTTGLPYRDYTRQSVVWRMANAVLSAVESEARRIEAGESCPTCPYGHDPDVREHKLSCPARGRMALPMREAGDKEGALTPGEGGRRVRRHGTVRGRHPVAMEGGSRRVHCVLTLRKSDFDADWYVIERAEHDGREWMEPDNADVEGTAEEMRELARAIRARSSAYFRRCAVAVVGSRVDFWSPRNSTAAGSVALADADALADEIDAKLGKEPTP